MCEATAAVAGAGLLINGASAIMEHNAQQEAFEANKKAAMEAAVEKNRSLNLRQMQEQAAAQQSIFDTDMEARRADAQSRVMAGESGVAGASVSMLLDDIERQRLTAEEMTKKNLDNMGIQLTQERRGIWSEAQSRINSMPRPNPWATGLKILGAGATAAGTYARNSSPTPGGK